MWIFVSAVFFVLICCLLFQLWAVKSLCGRLEASLCERKLLLMDGNSMAVSWMGLNRIIFEANELIEALRLFGDAENGYANQVDSTLGSIQEAVLIYDEDRVIEFANESARRIFQRGRPLKGAHLESILRSPELIGYLDLPNRPDTVGMLNPLRMGEGSDALWFEASRAEVVGISGPKSRSTLLVLHDVTRLKRLEMARRDFVANVSHELRTPLTIIKGFAETLVEDNEVLQVDVRARFLGKIVNNAERLNVLVEDLLTLSRLESKPEQFVPTSQSLKALLEEAVETYSERLDPESQEIQLEFRAEIEEFAFDRFRITQVVDNLIENAFKYAPDFKCLHVGAQLNDAEGLVECWVADDGPGIPEKDVPHLFERFYRVDKGRSRDRGGTGLGLSITKHIIQLHGGTVRVESKEGEGATFWFSLPYTRRVVSS